MILYILYSHVILDSTNYIVHLWTQVKSYARVHGQPHDNDKGHISIIYEKYVNGLYYERSEACAHLYRLVLVGAFIFLNVLTPVALAKSVSLYYPRIMAKSSNGDFKMCLYWAIALIAFLLNTVYTAASIRHHIFGNKPAITSCIIHLNHPCSIPSDTNVYKDEVITLVAVIAIVPSAVFIELLVSIYAVKYFFGQRSLRYGQQRNFWKHYLLQTVHVLALWNILKTVQIITTALLPVLVLLLIHPQMTFLYIMLLLMIPASLTFITAYLYCICVYSQVKNSRIENSAAMQGNVEQRLCT